MILPAAACIGLWSPYPLLCTTNFNEKCACSGRDRSLSLGDILIRHLVPQPSMSLFRPLGGWFLPLIGCSSADMEENGAQPPPPSDPVGMENTRCVVKTVVCHPQDVEYISLCLNLVIAGERCISLGCIVKGSPACGAGFLVL